LATNALPEPIIPDSIEPFIGYKALSTYHSNGLLYSPVYGFEWPLKEKAVAHCVGDLHKETSPAEACRCGFYAVSSPHAHSLTMLLDPFESVIVEVALWGKTILHTGGARGEFAYPQKIVAWNCPDTCAHDVAKNYGIKLAQVNHGMDWIGQATRATA